MLISTTHKHKSIPAHSTRPSIRASMEVRKNDRKKNWNDFFHWTYSNKSIKQRPAVVHSISSIKTVHWRNNFCSRDVHKFTITAVLPQMKKNEPHVFLSSSYSICVVAVAGSFHRMWVMRLVEYILFFLTVVSVCCRGIENDTKETHEKVAHKFRFGCTAATLAVVVSLSLSSPPPL